MRKLNISMNSLLIGTVIGALICCICLYIAGILGFNGSETKSDTYKLSYYAGNCLDVDDYFIEFVNNNPIDKKYLEKLDEANTPTEQAEVINLWRQVYDEEIETVWKEMENVINSQKEHVDSNITSEALDNLNRLKSSYNKYKTQDLYFSRNYKLATSGMGSGVDAYCCLLSLNKERIVFFDLVEQLVSWTGHFKFKTESSEYFTAHND